MHFAKLLGQRLMPPDFNRQFAEFQVRVVVTNGFTAHGIPVTTVEGAVCQEEGADRPTGDFNHRATLTIKNRTRR